MEGIRAIIFDWGRTLYDNDNNWLFPETKEVLEYCVQKYKLAVVSIAAQGESEERFAKLSLLGIRHYFQIALFSDKGSAAHEIAGFSLADTTQEMIDRIAFRQKMFLGRNAIGNLGVKPHEAVVVDDRARRIGWAIALGCKTIWIQKGKFAHELPNKETGHPTTTVKSLAEIMKFL